MIGLIRELRLAERSLRRDPVFSVAAVATLALGIGATTAVFSVLYGVLLSPLPFPDGERLVRLYSNNVQQNVVRGPMSGSDMWDMRTDARSVAAASPIYPYEGTLEDDAGNPIRIPAYAVSADFFDVFSTPMAMGRGFLPEEDEPQSPVEVVLSHQLWQSALGGDPAIVGTSVSFDAGTATVVGVAAPEMRYPRDAALWILPGLNWQDMSRRSRTWDVVAKLAPGATVPAAQTELSMVASRLSQEYVQWNSGVGVEVVPLKESIVGDLDVALLILMAASAGLLAVAAANVANLMLARGAARLQETALRAALGASRMRIVGTLFAEAFVTSFAGASGGILLAIGGVQLFKRMAPPSVSILGDVTFGWQPLAFAGVVTLGATLLFGLLPALRASSADLRSLLGDGGRRSTSGVHGAMLRSMLVVAEVGVATALVIGSGLLLKSFKAISETDPGFDTREAVVFNVVPPIGLYSDWDDVNQYYDALVQELKSTPGVQGVTTMATIPLGTEYDFFRPVRILDLAEPLQGEEPQAFLRPVGHDFFEVMGIEILEGRGFNDLDNKDGAPVALVNQAFVQRHLTDGRALGRPIRMYSSNFAPLGRLWNNEVEVVGVVDDVRYAGLTAAAEPAIYFPRQQAPFRRLHIVLTSTTDPADLFGAVRTRVAAADAQVAISGLGTLEGVLRASAVSQRFMATLLLVFGVVALVMAMVGIYGVVSYQVTERVREMAVRMSIGATPGEVMALILKSGARIWGLGIVTGIGGALLLRQVIASQLYGISATDPTIFVGAALILGGVSLAATSVPAFRTTRLAPASILREA
ncbi:MAG TPA: ABC transporter permease [Longimicrobiales bacterium]|nr:ABC transporter permease [Longimicrobiales bacterium]